MRNRALGALLVILVATPVPVLCAVCVPEACPMETAAVPAPAPAEAGCHGMTHAAPAPAAKLTAATPDCCVLAAPAQDGAPAVPATTLEGPVPAPAQQAAPVLVPRPSSTLASACESPPPEPLRPLYTLHSTLLI